jgi:hypothetical protein
MKLFTQIDYRLTRTAQASPPADVDEAESVTEPQEQPKPFVMKISSKWADVNKMLGALDDAGIDYDEDSVDRWGQGQHVGATLRLQSAKDVEEAAILLNQSPYFADIWSPVIGGSSPAIQKQIVKEMEAEILPRRLEELHEEMYERADSHKDQIVREFLETGNISWRKLPEGRIAKIWSDYAQMGFVRDTNGMADIAALAIDIVTRMMATNNLSGHEGTNDLNDLMEDNGFTNVDDRMWTDGERNINMSNFFWGENLYGSDYSMYDLTAAAILLMNAKTPEQQLTYVDRILNTVHQSSDLSLAFVEHGQDFLNKLYGAGK